MHPLDLPPTRTTPRILFDPAARTLTLKGESYPENSFQFFEPILAWVDDYLRERHETITIAVDMPYMNSSSTKCMLDLFDRFEDAYRGGQPILLHWSYDPDNGRALDLAEEFKEEVTFPFETVAARG
ncbi:DUF1987 domain-containing protein [uncultured Thiodictyon sp.]|uniref:DUF1987 domain-containing protein n=1 Tax=uncultured Thiodictyon sp. TaxID=1846217 RepID=UPI0025E14DBC|nr:DUF1987 domain-containing protein [uncultured Thiodictyon sp.]